MEHVEAIKILTTLKPLAQRLLWEGLDIELNPKEQNLLKDFTQVREAGLVSNAALFEKAGLTVQEVLLLAKAELKRLEKLIQEIYNQPLQDLSSQIRAAVIPRVGERKWAKMMMWFDDQINGKVSTAFHTLATEPEISLKQLAICWLVGKGYGRLTVKEIIGTDTANGLLAMLDTRGLSR